MDIDQIICSYRKLSVEDKRNENINNLKVLIAVFESICDKKRIKYDKSKYKDYLNRSNFVLEDEYLEGLFIYIDYLKELCGCYLEKES
ncbi:MAG: hypothetical protein ACI4WW_08325 [Candidatus Coprovivens sp.]